MRKVYEVAINLNANHQSATWAGQKIRDYLARTDTKTEYSVCGTDFEDQCNLETRGFSYQHSRAEGCYADVNRKDKHSRQERTFVHVFSLYGADCLWFQSKEVTERGLIVLIQKSLRKKAHKAG